MFRHQRPRSSGWALRLAAGLLLAFCSATPVGADIVLFTASSQDTVGNNPGGAPADPGLVNLPPLSPGVVLNPNPAGLDGNQTGALNGIAYGPNGFGPNIGGTTGFVNIHYTVQAGGSYTLTWEVADVQTTGAGSALATDNVRLNGSLLFGFESGIPAGFNVLGTVGTSNAITDLGPTEGNSFAFLDTTGGVASIYDTIDAVTGSRLVSSTFTAKAGDVLTLDAAFLTNDGDLLPGVGVVAMTAVPEPGILRLTALGLAGALLGRSLRGV